MTVLTVALMALCCVRLSVICQFLSYAITTLSKLWCL